MKITSFSPLIMTNDAEKVGKLFEDLGFVKQHEKKDVTENKDSGFRMKDAGGHGVSIAQVNRELPQDMTAVQLNVDDFEGMIDMLNARGFRNKMGEGNYVDTGSSKTAMMISPSGFALNVVYHIKNR